MNAAFDPILALVVVSIDVGLYAGKFFQQSESLPWHSIGCGDRADRRGSGKRGATFSSESSAFSKASRNQLQLFRAYSPIPLR